MFPLQKLLQANREPNHFSKTVGCAAGQKAVFQAFAKRLFFQALDPTLKVQQLVVRLLGLVQLALLLPELVQLAFQLMLLLPQLVQLVVLLPQLVQLAFQLVVLLPQLVLLVGLVLKEVLAQQVVLLPPSQQLAQVVLVVPLEVVQQL